VVAAVLLIVMLLIDAGVPLRLAVAVVDPVKTAVSLERGGASVPVQLADELQAPVVPPFHVETEAWEVAQAARKTPVVSQCFLSGRLTNAVARLAERISLSIGI
jgi:hypothetical protein